MIDCYLNVLIFPALVLREEAGISHHASDVTDVRRNVAALCLRVLRQARAVVKSLSRL